MLMGKLLQIKLKKEFVLTNLKKKFKEREPMETVNILKSFFKSKGCTTTEKTFSSEIGTWTTHLELFKDGLYIIQSNGKGMTKEFCLASAYAELYERFCNMHPLICNPTFVQSLMNINKDEKGYYFDKNEQPIDFNYIQQNNPEISNFLLRLLKNETNVKRYLDAQFGTLIGIPFHSVKDDSVIYVDPRVASISWTSMGLSAGNTIDEALSQAMSELCERIGTANFFLQNCEHYYALNLDNIENKDIQEKIENIQKAGYIFYVFDLSYNFKVPTLCALLIDPVNLTSRVNFGSFPCFDIAIERTITEIYQGVSTYRDAESYFQTPFRKCGVINFLNSALNNISETNCIQEDIFDKIVEIDTYNHDYFIPEKRSNEEIVSYLTQIFEKLNLECYFADMSLMEDVKAIRVICPKLNIMEEKIRKFEKLSPLWIEDALKQIEESHKLINSTLELQSDNSKEKIKDIYGQINKCIDNFYHTSELVQIFISNLTFSSTEMILNTSSENILMVLSQWNRDDLDFTVFRHTYWMPALKKYKTLWRYVRCKKYTDEEIIKYMAALGAEITTEDIQNITDIDYIIMKIFIETTLMLYYSPFYKSILEMFIR